MDTKGECMCHGPGVNGAQAKQTFCQSASTEECGDGVIGMASSAGDLEPSDSVSTKREPENEGQRERERERER